MDRTASLRWQKALVISFVMHCLVLISAGYIAGRFFMPVAVPATLIELSLLNEEDWEQNTAAIEQHSLASFETVRNSPQTVSKAVPATEIAAEPAVAVGNTAGKSVDTGIVAAGSISVNRENALPGAPSPGKEESQGSRQEQLRDIIPPKILARREPAYPEQARYAGVEGTVVLSIEILQNGCAGEVSVSHSSGSYLLDAAAVEAVQRWRFVPAKARGTGQNIACQTTMPIVFKLKG